MSFLKRVVFSKRALLFVLTLGLTQVPTVTAKTAAVLSPENQAIVVAGLAALTKIVDEAKR